MINQQHDVAQGLQTVFKSVKKQKLAEKGADILNFTLNNLATKVGGQFMLYRHLYQLSRIMRESSGYRTNLSVSSKGNQIYRIKATLYLCTAVS